MLPSLAPAGTRGDPQTEPNMVKVVGTSKSVPETWVERLQQDSADRECAIAELRSYLIRGLSGALTHRYGGRIDIDDVAQLALLKILDSLHLFRHQSRFTTWATAIAVRIGISELRRHYYRDVSLDTSETAASLEMEVEDVSARTSDDHMDRSRLFSILQTLIDQSLTEKQRLAIRGTLEGLPIEEIAVRLGSNRNAVYKLVHDARMRLREGFEAHGLTANDIMMSIS